MPAHDGTPRVWYSVLTPVDGGLRIEHRALAYDHAAAAAAMTRAGLPSDYREALATGFWPSCDVLPYREIRESGVAIAPGTVVWADAPCPAAARARRRAGASLAHQRAAQRAAARCAEIPAPAPHRQGRAARPRRAAAAGDAVVQHRHAVQHHLPQLLHRVEPAQRPPRLPHARRHPPLPRRDRARAASAPARSASPAASRS